MFEQETRFLKNPPTTTSTKVKEGLQPLDLHLHPIMAKNHSSSHEKTSELEKVFSRFDANGDGKVSASELASVMRALGSPPSEDELSRMMTEMDSDGDGFVDLKEFVEFYGGGGGGGEGDGKEIRDAFEMYDQNKDGKISAKELHRVLKSLGERCSVEDCSRMIRSVDSDGDGSVNFEEFKEMMSRGKI